MRGHVIALCVGVWLLAAASPAAAQKRKLSDEDLDKVSAAGVSAELVNGVVKLQFQSSAGAKQKVEGGGTIQLQSEPLAGTAGTLILQDSAQGNLRSLININAVNSKIQVLVNLNININSTVGTIRQINLSGMIPPP